MRHKCKIKRLTTVVGYNRYKYYWRVKCTECLYDKYPEVWQDAINLAIRHYCVNKYR